MNHSKTVSLLTVRRTRSTSSLCFCSEVMTSQCKAAEQQQQRTRNDTLVSPILWRIEIVVTDNFSSDNNQTNLHCVSTSAQSCSIRNLRFRGSCSRILCLLMVKDVYKGAGSSFPSGIKVGLCNAKGQCNNAGLTAELAEAPCPRIIWEAAH